MQKVGLIGWRGMVGSVLMSRLREMNDFAHFSAHFFSTSQIGQSAPLEACHAILHDAHDIVQLADMDIVLSCQGGAYTEKIYPQLRQAGWQGYWIDAASTRRMTDDSVIVLDPVNQAAIEQAIDQGQKDFIGGNCTVSLLLMAIAPLFQENLVEWVSSMTYQAISGAGAQAMTTFVAQMQSMTQTVNLSDAALSIDRSLQTAVHAAELPTTGIGFPLAANVLPWIDTAVAQGQTREEWKAMVEANKILANDVPVPIDGTCVRVGAMRSHSQALTIKLKQSIDLSTVESLLHNWHPWLRWVDNSRAASLAQLTPLSVSGTLDIAVGRVRHLAMGRDYLNLFTVGDQLLWGAAEPLRRILMQLLSV